MRFTGINHLAMATGDMDATIRYWRDLLGMRLVAGLGHPGSRHYFFEISAQDMIAFFEWPGVEPGPDKDHGAPVRGPFTFDHISFGLEDENALWELRDRLDAAGFWVSEVVDHGFIRSLYSFDPNNIAVEFSVPAPGVDLRAQPVMADSAPTPLARQGAEPVPGAWPEPVAPTRPEDRRAYPGEGLLLVGRDPAAEGRAGGGKGPRHV
ncbi:Catechol 2,3-dioxygenase [Humidesulfovibrio mexicanus]|uniref:Catechol 2,3-dioxygenase n=1 Tax=Humidesulfovibrio mexicanus TaxID=147047 RepID=A0A238ZS34_9BACT|nr:VOC family protein [Humidesulfovibrio mexicanus]SNR86236.1 Catechol 2,3-dioxygenase [Humidesulfovibrio mexicanus]